MLYLRPHILPLPLLLPLLLLLLLLWVHLSALIFHHSSVFFQVLRPIR